VLVAALPLFGVLLAGPALAGNLAILTGAAAVLAVTVNVANVAMNAHGVAVEQRLGRPILSSLYAMHSLGGITGAGLAALAAGFGVGRAGHLLTVAGGAALTAVVASRLLLPSSIDASRAGPAAPRPSAHGGAGWLRGWSGRVLALGGLAFCVELALSR
jgi:hypothetical protein